MMQRKEIALSASLRANQQLIVFVLSISIVALISASSVASVPNIRIQVNNENLQNPPYLLEALKQIDAEEKHTSAVADKSGLISDADSLSSARFQDGHQANPVGSQAVINDASETMMTNVNERPLNVAEPHSSDESLDIDPESILKLAPEAMAAGSMSALEFLQSSIVEHDSSASEQQDSRNRMNGPKQSSSRPFQLDVTSSHLKRPSLTSSALIEDEPLSESSHDPNIPSRQHQGPEMQPGPGAKSRVSPSVTSDEMAPLYPSDASRDTEQKEKKTPSTPPDTIEPSQVMQGVTNASLVPATVKRQYGHQTRTRITLGGGYQRESQPPLVNPSSSEYVDSKPEKPVVPLERPQKNDQSSSVSDESSRVIEVPERIVVPVEALVKQNNSTADVNRRRDMRCPKSGVSSLEHPSACDKYLLCEDGYMSEQVCPNGLMYGTRDIVRDFCVHRWQVVCGDKSIPNPISSPGCRWQNGIFNVQGSPKCTPDFYECTDGIFEVKKCTISGQIYDDKTKSCQYAEQVGCAQEALSDFQCPADDQSNTYWPFPRYFLNERALIHCINDKPQIIRCRDHERVDPEHLFCIPIDPSKPAVNEDGSTVEATVSARRAVSSTQREKGKPAQKQSKE